MSEVILKEEVIKMLTKTIYHSVRLGIESGKSGQAPDDISAYTEATESMFKVLDEICDGKLTVIL